MIRDEQPRAAQHPGLARRLTAEAIGSFFLFCVVIGSGIMGENLSGGNVAIALLANTLATGAILFVIILTLAPLSGAHFNPAVTLVAFIRRELPAREATLYVLAQLVGGIIGVWAAHLMFDLDILQFSTKTRTGTGQWAGEAIATFGLIFTILGAIRYRPSWVAPAVGLFISAGYWFTSSTSFANPAITIARGLSDTFAGIAPADIGPFLIAQFTGALLAGLIGGWLFAESDAKPLPHG
ncbi:MAG: MIP/aquaporin family protein [Pseudomonadota bacterium]